MCSCILAHVVHFLPVLTSSLSLSTALSLYLSVPSKMRFHQPCDTEFDVVWHSRAPAACLAGRAGCCVIAQPACHPSVSAMTLSKRATAEHFVME